MLNFLILTLSTTLLINTDWQLKKEKHGIEIYTRSVEGSSFHEFKAITTVENTSVVQVLDVIFDVDNYESLYADCINPRILEKEGKYYDIHYVQTKGPLTVKDRDGVYEQKAEIRKDGKYAIVYIKPLPDYIVVNENMVRIRKGMGYWEMEETEPGRVKVTYQFHGEPGGEIPAWIANSFVVSHPMGTMKNLKLRLTGKD